MVHENECTFNDGGKATPNTRCNCICARDPFHGGNDDDDDDNIIPVADDTNDVPHTKHMRH